MANDDQKHEENLPQIYYQLNKWDNICVKLADKKSVYFKLCNINNFKTFKTKPHVQIEDDDPVFFKLAKKETIILKQANTRNEVSFELNESHRFYFKADEALYFELDLSRMSFFGTPGLLVNLPYYYKIEEPKKHFLKLAVPLDVQIELASDRQQDGKVPKVYYQLNERDQISVKLVDRKPIYFQALYNGGLHLKDAVFGRIEDCVQTVLFKLPIGETLIIKQADTQEPVYFELNESHRFFFRSNKFVCFSLSCYPSIDLPLKRSFLSPHKQMIINADNI